MKYFKNGWYSSYDYDGMSNTEKYTGRFLHQQDRCWGLAKIFMVILAIYIFWLWKQGDIDLSGIRSLLNIINN